jgi:mRNA interferase HicA
VKRRALLGHLGEHGCVPLREGGSHSIWQNPQTGRKEAIPGKGVSIDEVRKRFD